MNCGVAHVVTSYSHSRNQVSGRNQKPFVIDFYCLLSKETYSHPLRSYHLIKSEAQCQFLKKGSRCGQEHSHGYAVECKGGQQVLIGNCCAFNLSII